MGLANAVFLLVVAFQALAFRYSQYGGQPKPSRLYDAALWSSIAAIGLVACRALVSLTPFSGP
jgi:hypothetical protein